MIVEVKLNEPFPISAKWVFEQELHEQVSCSLRGQQQLLERTQLPDRYVQWANELTW